MILINKNNNAVLSKKVLVCRSVFSRLRGLLGRPALTEDESCWIVPCNSVHTIGMRYPIDVYFLDKKNKVVSILQDLRPNRFSPVCFRAHSVLEMLSGVPRKCGVGDNLSAEECHASA